MINEKMKYPSNKERYDKHYIKIFGERCDVCNGRGFHTDYDGVQKKWLKTTCLICNGTGYRN